MGLHKFLKQLKAAVLPVDLLRLFPPPEMSSVACSATYPRLPSTFSAQSSTSSPSSLSSIPWLKALRFPSPVISRPHPAYRRFLPRAINLSDDNPSDLSRNICLDRIMAAAHKVLDDVPQPVKRFPWARALESFSRLIFDLSCSVVKYLSVPVLAVSCLSEMSYCGHERKLMLMPFPFLFGFALAGVLSNTAIDLSQGLKEGDYPWHLFLVASFFLMLKLPGPYYPYWGRLIIPHFANGGLWRTVWFVFAWYRVGRKILQPESDSRDAGL